MDQDRLGPPLNPINFFKRKNIKKIIIIFLIVFFIALVEILMHYLGIELFSKTDLLVELLKYAEINDTCSYEKKL